MRDLAFGVAVTALLTGVAAVVWALVELQFRMQPRQRRRHRAGIPKTDSK